MEQFCLPRVGASKAATGQPFYYEVKAMNQVIYLVGLVVVVMAILSFVGIHV